MRHLKLSTKFILFSLWLFAAVFRFYNLNWDQGYHLHPDERAIILAVVKLGYPTSLSSFFSVDSPWNPHFFAYGSLPFYLLKIVGDGLGVFNKLFAGYDLINIAGRFMSAMFDLITLLLVFLLGKKLTGTFVGFLAAFFYAVSVLPIQLSHFYAVDTMLTCFMIAVLYQLIHFYEQPSVKRSLLIGILFGLALATKISAVVLLVPIGATITMEFLSLFLKQPHKPRIWLPHISSFLRHLCMYGFCILVMAAATFVFCEPYAVIDFREFWLHTTQQSAMTSNAYIFPYTLQYVGKVPYIYELRNIFFWGLGPLLASLAFAGTIYATYLTFSKVRHPDKQGTRADKMSTFFQTDSKRAKEIILVTFFWVYFFVVGRFAVGFMRYMLPIYPLLALFAAVFVNRLLGFYTFRLRYKAVLLLYCGVLLLIWPVSFSRIYMQPNTRTSASQWINHYIPVGKTIAVEHWDDQLPLFGVQNYHFVTLPLYDPDTDIKWTVVNQALQQTDYIVIASNRLYVPLQKLIDCTHLPQERCYPRTSAYYRALFAGKLGFTKVADFTDYPIIPFFDVPINDQPADESFTVYDHPRVMIFQKDRN